EVTSATAAASTTVTAAVTTTTTIIEVAVPRWSTSILLDIDQLTRDAGVAQTIQNGRIHLLWQVNQGVANRNGDASEVRSGQTALVRDSANNCTWANVLTLAHVQTVGLEVADGTTLAASTTIVAVETVTATATAVTVASTSAAIITIETV